ncbi:unnamed protein product, partial [Clonostachys rhizophaga]
MSEHQAIAIVGSGCRFPGGASSPDQLWDILRAPKQLAIPIPQDRFNAKGFYHDKSQYHGHLNVKEAYFIEGEREFDAPFFNINPAEAKCLDPQVRLLLEVIYEALEAGGQNVDDLRGSQTAMYTGQMLAEYEQITSRDTDAPVGTYLASGTARAMLSNRISYLYDWHGPSMTIDTACSSSLVALHQAIQQLRTGQSRMAVAAGVNLLLDPKDFLSLGMLSMLSPSGRCRMWDASADGYARGDAIAAVIVKTLQSAIEDGDQIECIIRETGLNQDGKTKGITAPNHEAQTQLIRDCYSRAGLDLNHPADRPQFFECHGTGTLAGDAAEAEAISNAFFSSDLRPNGTPIENFQKLVVGSIKTVVGHTEGTAGLAGILKASLALQNAMIPPNLLFEKLNPRIEPFYDNLKLSTAQTPWPLLPDNVPRRSPIRFPSPTTRENYRLLTHEPSFGFGGANAHAILESYNPEQNPETSSPDVVYTPFVFSASSASSLVAYLKRFCAYLEANSHKFRLRDLAYTLHSRRTRLPYAATFSASTVETLLAGVKEKLKGVREDGKTSAVVQLKRKENQVLHKPRLLGIFTGQGAQWAGMGSELIHGSERAAGIISKLEKRLACLPESDRPEWSLMEELLKTPETSRIGEASLSQPLCTAIQILQVDLLRASGVTFHSVVGHSSGEIAAAHAAGFLSSDEAICIAYYRGLHARLASGKSPGAMMAVGSSEEDIQELCDDPALRGRLSIAAVNSPASVTVSGDRDAIEEMQVILGDEKKFARLLKVDTAYHSYHMNACASAYLDSLSTLGIRPKDGNQTTWFSSVLDGKCMTGQHGALKGEYWNTNMTQPVLFSRAISEAWKMAEEFDLVIEVGPHPALKGPALQSIQELSTSVVPYTGIFRRGSSAIESVADGLGCIWAHLGRDAVNLQAYDNFVAGESSPCKLLKGLPTYNWDQQEYWTESRQARAYRLRPDRVHELLGHMGPDSNKQAMHWRHILRPFEFPWIRGHKLQGQMVFPGAAYAVTALEAAVAMCKKLAVSARLVEIIDLDIEKALVFDLEDSSFEVIISMVDIRCSTPGSVTANFTYHSGEVKGDSGLSLMVKASVHVAIGEPSINALPTHPMQPPNMLPVDVDKFYSASRGVGYEWEGAFRGMSSAQRKLGWAAGTVESIEESELICHPALLDSAFQAINLARSYPEDGQLKRIEVPKMIRRISFNPYLCANKAKKGSLLRFLASNHPDALTTDGTIAVYPGDCSSNSALLQVCGFQCVPLAPVTAQDDKEAFAKMIWDVAEPDAESMDLVESLTLPRHLEIAGALEKLSLSFLQQLEQKMQTNLPARSQTLHSQILTFANEARALVQARNPEWKCDTYEDLVLSLGHLNEVADIKILREACEILSFRIIDDKPHLEGDAQLQRRFCAETIGPSIYYDLLAEVVRQLTHRNPHMSMLQIGVGEGLAIEVILGQIGEAFSSYTCTDSSADCVDAVKTRMSHHEKLSFKKLILAEDASKQGFAKESYDVIIVALTLHTMPNVKYALRSARTLLRPGGQLVVLEALPSHSYVYRLILEASQSWDQEEGDEKRASPALLDPVQWNELLLETGFSGCDTVSQQATEGNCLSHFTVFTSQAVDEKLTFMRDPLSTSSDGLFAETKLLEDLLILGGAQLRTARLIQRIAGLLKPYSGRVRVAPTLAHVSTETVSPQTTLLGLAQLDGPMLENISSHDWDTLRSLLMNAGSLFWVTAGRRAESPFGTMMAGLIRSVVREALTLDWQMLDFEGTKIVDPYMLVEGLLRFQAQVFWRKQGASIAPAEAELVIDQRGRFLVPRLITCRYMNDRYNSQGRPITIKLDHRVKDVYIKSSNGALGYYNLGHDALPAPDGLESTVQIETSHSLLSAVRVTEFDCLFVMVGKRENSGQRLIALSTECSSRALPLETLSIQATVQEGDECKYLSLVANYLLTVFVTRGLHSSDVVVVFEPSAVFASTLANQSKELGLHLRFLTMSAEKAVESKDENWILIHQSASEHELSSVIPPNTSVFINYLGLPDNEFILNRLDKFLPRLCRRESLNTLFMNTGKNPSDDLMREVSKRLKEAVAYAAVHIAEVGARAHDEVPVLSIDAVPDASAANTVPYSCVCWTVASKLGVQVRPMDTQIKFSARKSYWFAGLSKGLGLALCEWMARRGARYFVVSSRTPKIDPSWIQSMHRKGVLIKISPCSDITNKDRVVAVYQEICETLPPIGGVLQGSSLLTAVVIENVAIRDMTLEKFLTGTRSKVEGSVHLNNLFQQNNIDFFVFFSSVVAVIGRPGQANYSAPNMFMAALAEQRRRKGLAGSIIHLGAVFGIGYATMQQDDIYTPTRLKASGLIPTAERDFYQLFAEAVVAGRPGSGADSIELVSGLGRIAYDEPEPPAWGTEPMMRHFVRSPDQSSNKGAGNHVSLPFKVQLAQAKTRAQVSGMITEAFTQKLYSVFQMDENMMNLAELIQKRIDEMGIDSLMAVEIRSWFMTNLEVNIPILKILGGITVAELIKTAADTIPDRLVPGLVSEEGADRAVVEKTSVEEPNSAGHDSGIEVNESLDDTNDSNSSIQDQTTQPDDTPAVPSQSVVTSQPKFVKTSKLSYSQDMFWFVWSFLEDKSSLNHTAWGRVTGQVQVGDFESAWVTMISRHEILRTCIIQQDGKPVQAVMAESHLPFEVRKVSREEEVYQLVQNLQDRWVYDIAIGQTIRSYLLSLSPTEHFFVIGFHPLVADGMTAIIMIKEIQELYAASSHKLTLNMHLPRQYSNYSNQQHADYAQGRFEKDLQFWKQQFNPMPPPLPILTLSTSSSRPDLAKYANKQAVLRIGTQLKKQVQDTCRKHRITPFHFYLSVFRVLLLRYSPAGDGEDVCIGIGDANRTEDEMLDVLGPFVNFLPVRLCTQGSTKFSDLLQQAREKAYEAISHSKVPFQVLLQELNITPSPSHPSLYQCFTNYRQGLLNSTNFGDAQGDLTIHSIDVNISKQPYDLTFEMVDFIEGDCVQTLLVREDLYGQEGAQMLLDSYERLVKAFVGDATLTLEQPGLFDQRDIASALSISRGPFSPRRWPESVIHKIEEVAATRRDEIAVRHLGISRTYGEILANANTIAATLQATGVSEGSVVGVLLEPSPSWISSVLGVMRLGAIYLPLDLSHPPTRLSTIIDDCQPSAVLVDKYDAGFFQALGAPQIHFLQVPHHNDHSAPVPIKAVANGPAVMFYTSGSSGTPKGVLLKHESLRNWAEGSIASLYDLGPEIVLQQTTPVFDISLEQVFIALCYGGTLCIVPREHRADAEAVCKIIEEYGVTFTIATPTEMTGWLQHRKRQMPKANDNWKRAFCEGEDLTEYLVKLASQDHSNFELYNIYGPTEATKTVTGMRIPLDCQIAGPVAAGFPHPNCSVYVVDSQLRPVPKGVQGEVYLGGAGIAIKYHNREKLTAAKFVSNPFATDDDKLHGWTTLHRTGDVGRWRREDGMLMIEGRIDTQVKLRGARIDLAEIEQAILASDEAVVEAVVSVRKPSSSKTTLLVSHVVLDPSCLDPGERIRAIQSRLGERLPLYMCPAVILQLDRVPLTSAGKLDRILISKLTLPEYDHKSFRDDRRPDEVLSSTEIRLRDIWAAVVGLRYNITSETSFFHAGGSSLLLLDLKNRIQEAFGIDMPLLRMFEFSTLNLMAHWIDRGTQEEPYQADIIDWAEETALPSSLLDAYRDYDSNKGQALDNLKNPRRVVVLTGATGQLGKALLELLVASSSIQHVHCVGVRTPSKLKLDVNENKISVYKGDMNLPRLGLSKDEAATIFSQTDLIIHNSADMSYLKTYATLRATNLQSTKELAYMLVQYGKIEKASFHFVSTISVGNLLTLAQNVPNDAGTGQVQFNPTSMAGCLPPNTMSSTHVYKQAYGYICTKWASEVFLEKLSEQVPGIAVVIHRPSSIAQLGSEATAVQGLEFVKSVSRYSSIIGALPKVPEGLNLSGGFNIAPLEVVANGIMDEVERLDSKSVHLQFLHHLGELELSLTDVRGWAEDEKGEAVVEEMEISEWVQKAKEAGMHIAM